ncbi:hypothetical protein KEF85_11290 [Methylomonas paludis]|uniref:Uncharacterized protein n=1 Tax=Methylomonas paludis TaxID=1173101 RepID=A0A975R992_9GAMM|nr:hypothetical protein [Methylomonas paludis]QWF69936.1 hypothetical protein KEF85_11290 [Methylomonas paludis]
MTTAHKWQFAASFRYHAFGWRSDKPLLRIKEALAEIKLLAKQQPELAAAGAVLFLEKISPAIEQVDSSSGAIGSAVQRAIATLVPIICQAKVEPAQRNRWLERLWEAIQVDHVPYIESLGDYWGELCVTPEAASEWADDFLPLLEDSWGPQTAGHAHFCGTVACLSALYAAGRHLELLALLETAPFQWWTYRSWGVKSLLALGRKAQAIRYAEAGTEFNAPVVAIAQTCEAILLSSGLAEAAYQRYALTANQNTTHLATFRAIVKKYPQLQPADILRDLIARHPGSEGKWFAAAKSAGLFDLATELAQQSPTDPRTLIRASRDFAEQRPEFAIAVGLSALNWIARGYGYEIGATDVLDAYAALVKAAQYSGLDEVQIRVKISELLAKQANSLIAGTLHQQLSA